MAIRNNSSSSSTSTSIRLHPPRFSSWAPATRNSSENHNETKTPQGSTRQSGGAPSSSAARGKSSPETSLSFPSEEGSIGEFTRQISSLHDEMAAVVEPNPFRDPAIAHCSVLTNDAVRCRHLEECMFPRFLTLDCNQLDDFTLRHVDGGDTRKNLGRIYIESLHLKEFLKDPESILAHRRSLMKEAPGKSTGKRSRETKKSISAVGSSSSISLSSKKSKSKEQNQKSKTTPKLSSQTLSSTSAASKERKLSPEEMERVSNSNLLSQSYFGGLEGKRTWLVANAHRKGVGGGLASSHCQIVPSSTLHDNSADQSDSKILEGKEKSTSDDYFKSLVASEIKLASLRKSFRLHDRTAMIDKFISNRSDDSRPLEDRETKVLESLLKPPTGFVVPDTLLKDEDQSKNPTEKSENDTNNNQNKHSEIPAFAADKSSDLKSENKLPSTTSSSTNNNASNARKSKDNPKKDRGTASASKRNSSSKVVNTESAYDRALQEGKQASIRANLLLDAFRRNRRNFWTNLPPKCLWCPSESTESTNKKTTPNVSKVGVNSMNESILSRASGDSLIQCLECDMVGCGPTFLDNRYGNNQHAMLHFLMSGHKFGVTCGPMGEIFCMACGDFIYHECFDQERERLFVEIHFPSLCWKETPILRGVDPSSFIFTPEHGVMWRGMMATYPNPVSTQIVHASRFAAKRLLMFRGLVGEKTIDWGPKALALAIYQQRHLNKELIAPVGIYNLGNTCFINAVLQCLIHCPLLQDLFLRQMVHPYKCCEALRWGSNKLSCLTCELDKLFLEYYGSSIGIDVIAASEEQRVPSEAFFSNTIDNPNSTSKPNSSFAGLTCNKKQHPEYRGHPIVPSSLLAEIWKNIRSIARNDQHDSQEFFQAFLDSLETHTLFYQKLAREMRQVYYQSEIKHSTPFELAQSKVAEIDSVKKIFTGILRSTLVCEKCGCKRIQSEPFTNISLPLAKEFQASASTAETGSRSSPRKGKISVEICLEHFTLPEVLTDPVHCPSCSTKTRTIKQHTFSKLPKVLCLHLKRFDAAGSNKINEFVSFPALGLDLGSYLPHWSEIIQGHGEDETRNSNGGADSPKVLYDLFGIVNHKGSLNQGHYMCRVKFGEHWYNCNDSFVSKAGEGTGENDVRQSDDAYMLFYIQRAK